MHIDESFWLAVSFVILIYFGYKPVRTSILGMLDSKISEIKKRVEEAEGLRKQTEDLLIKTKTEIANLESLRIKVLEEASQKAQEIAESKKSEYEASILRDKMAAEVALRIKGDELSNQIREEFVSNINALVSKYLTSDEVKVDDIEVAKTVGKIL
jgi:F-type H+-transporting ATPase subunit b